MLTLYHGSDKINQTPEYGAGKEHNDFGIGFYCTENIELAKEWACSSLKDGYIPFYIPFFILYYASPIFRRFPAWITALFLTLL